TWRNTMEMGFSALLAISLVVPTVETAIAANNSHPTISVASIQGRNSVSGIVFGESRMPVAEVHVELLDELGTTITRTKTTGSGRYSFQGLSNGRFKIRVFPVGTDYMEQIQEVLLAAVSAVAGSGSDNQQIDFYLRLRAAANAGPFSVPGTIFAQEVPEEARKFFELGISQLRQKKEKEGFDNLKSALAVFPNYFLALDRLGTEYAARGNINPNYFEAARILLTKAIEINPRSYSSMFGLGFTQYHQGMVNEAIDHLERAVSLYNKSANGYLWLGIAQKRAGKLVQAETSLKRANELTKGSEPDVHWQLAGLYSDQKRYAEAATEFELFLKNKPDARDAEKIKQVIAQLKQKAGSP
ncbi:MAG TPA: tetratricopeptide repeat protein, partial [Pyrinomonadaceae bacterium]